MRRFLESLRSFEASAQGDPPGPPADRVPLLPAPVYARLTAHDASGYSWVQSEPKTDGTWSDLAHGLASASSGKAFEIGGRTDVAADTIVRLESRQTSDGLPIWVFGGGGEGTKLKFAKVVARKTAANGAWTSFEDDGFPSHYTANPCDSAGANVDTETTLYLLGHDGATGFNFGFIAGQTSAIVAYLPGDGEKAVPGDAGTKLDGFILPGILGAVLRPADTFNDPPSEYQPITARDGKFRADDWLRLHN